MKLIMKFKANATFILKFPYEKSTAVKASLLALAPWALLYRLNGLTIWQKVKILTDFKIIGFHSIWLEC